MKSAEKKTAIQLCACLMVMIFLLPEMVDNFYAIMQFIGAAIAIFSLAVVVVMAYLHWQYSRKQPGVNT